MAMDPPHLEGWKPIGNLEMIVSKLNAAATVESRTPGPLPLNPLNPQQHLQDIHHGTAIVSPFFPLENDLQRYSPRKEIDDFTGLGMSRKFMKIPGVTLLNPRLRGQNGLTLHPILLFLPVNHPKFSSVEISLSFARMQ